MSSSERFKGHRQLPNILFDRSVHDYLVVQRDVRGVNLCLGKTEFIDYTKEIEGDSSGRRVDIDESDLKGTLFLNGEFFPERDPVPSKYHSDMMNLGKSFFLVNGVNHMALAQYLFEGGTSSEHYHTLEESIIQLAGRSLVAMRSIVDDMDYSEVELNAGDSLRIPVGISHSLRAIGGGSLTAPIKETRPGFRDSLYQDKSEARIKSEFEENFDHAHFNSGGDEAVSIRKYFESLTDVERKRFEELYGTWDDD